MPTQANQPLADGYQLQNYRVHKVLSSGGFSIVYLAHDENDVPVAIKEYLPASLALRNQGDALPAIAVAGYSLGGNLALKLAGEYGRNSPPALRAIAAVSPIM